MGIHSINSFMKSMAVHKPHSVQPKRCLRNSRLPNNLTLQVLMSLTIKYAHSLTGYEEGNNNEQWLISSIISSDRQANTFNKHHPLQNIFPSSAVQNKLLMNEEWLMTINNFLGCQMTINCQLSQTFPESRCNVVQAESIADDC